MFAWKTLPKPIIALSPMADLTDLPFCFICKEYGAPIVFREMISSEALIRLNPKTLKMAECDERERPIIQQIFGSDPHIMAKAAQIIEERFSPDGIDINMGCPVYNLVSHFNGASLIQEPERAAAIVKAVKAAVTVPVSVKTRLGWKQDTECLEFVKVLEEAGTDLISIHARTKEQGYSGRAQWDRVREARKNIPQTPVLVNGDITTPELAREALRASETDGMLIGRGALGNPWIFQQVTAAFSSNPLNKAVAMVPSIQDRVVVIKRHAQLQVEHYGERGLIKLRKHLPWYLKGIHGWKEFRSALVRVSTLEELNAILEKIV